MIVSGQHVSTFAFCCVAPLNVCYIVLVNVNQTVLHLKQFIMHSTVNWEN